MSKINKLGAEEIESTELQTALRTLTEASALYDRVFKDLAPTASSSTVVASTSLFKAKLLLLLPDTSLRMPTLMGTGFLIPLLNAAGPLNFLPSHKPRWSLLLTKNA